MDNKCTAQKQPYLHLFNLDSWWIAKCMCSVLVAILRLKSIYLHGKSSNLFKQNWKIHRPTHFSSIRPLFFFHSLYIIIIAFHYTLEFIFFYFCIPLDFTWFHRFELRIHEYPYRFAKKSWLNDIRGRFVKWQININ